MKNQKGFTIVKLVAVLFFVFGMSIWIVNAVKLASCDFESNYKCEVLHGAGLIVPPLSFVTVWFADDGA